MKNISKYVVPGVILSILMMTTSIHATTFQEFSADQIKNVQIRGDGGRIEISSLEEGGKPARVTYLKQNEGSQASIELVGQTLYLTNLRLGEDNSIVDYTLELPKNSNIDIDMGSSERIAVKNMHGSLSIKGGESKNVEIDSPLSNLTAGMGNLKLVARNLLGGVSLNFPKGHAEIFYNDQLENIPPRNISIITVNGNAVIHLPPAATVSWPSAVRETHLSSDFQRTTQGISNFNINFTSLKGKLNLSKM
jgi:hypothetical protein